MIINNWEYNWLLLLCLKSIGYGWLIDRLISWFEENIDWNQTKQKTKRQTTTKRVIKFLSSLFHFISFWSFGFLFFVTFPFSFMSRYIFYFLDQHSPTNKKKKKHQNFCCFFMLVILVTDRFFFSLSLSLSFSLMMNNLIEDEVYEWRIVECFGKPGKKWCREKNNKICFNLVLFFWPDRFWVNIVNALKKKIFRITELKTHNFHSFISFILFALFTSIEK